MNKIELLAPAKNLECGIAAINCGADAVYIGAPQFGAREAAGNSLKDIIELSNYAHKYWARVYATVNTLLYDSEIPQVLAMISELYQAGVDGLIIQDTALLECDLPPIPLIASTQMHNNTPEKVAFMGKVGIKRAILARELDLDQIRAIRKATDIELEFFVHGALCVCYSGQCYLSYALGGRSGNRGQCAQPCRKAYSLRNSTGRVLVRNKHLLSLRDLNLSEYLRDLIKAGICSFKIEGRLKDKAYVSNVVSYYRQKLDSILCEVGMRKSSSGISTIDFQPDVNKTFNRGYTSYFINGRKEKIGSIDTPKMVGERIGSIISAGKLGLKIDCTADLRAGDGICFFGKSGELCGTLVNGVKGGLVLADRVGGIPQGTVVYRNSDSEFLSRLNRARAERSIAIEMTLQNTADGLSLSIVDEDGNCASVSMCCDKIPAQKPEQALTNIEKQLLKVGGTEFVCSRISLKLMQTYFLPISALNSLRRSALDELRVVRNTNRPVEKAEVVNNNVLYPQSELTFEGNVLNRYAQRFYVRHGVKSIEPAAESGLDMHGRKVMTTRYCIRHQLGICPKFGKDPRAQEKLYLVDMEGNELELRFDCARCEMQVFLASYKD